MSAKIAKRIRKELRYHPKMERTYTVQKFPKGTVLVEISSSDPRSLYQEMKKGE